MTERNKERSWSTTDAAKLLTTLYEIQNSLITKEIFKPDLDLAFSDQEKDVVTLEARRDAVHSLRFLSVWFDLPENGYFVAVILMDAFLTKMRVKKKFLACLTISCLYLSTVIHNVNVNVLHLINISQSKCTDQDMYRMSNIVQEKLNLEVKLQPVTALDYLYAFLKVFELMSGAGVTETFLITALEKELLIRRLQVIVIDSKCASFRSCILALALIHISNNWPNFTNEISNEIESHSDNAQCNVIVQLQQICQVSEDEYTVCYKQVLIVLEEYDDHKKSRPSQRLEWRFSKSIRNAAKPSDNFVVCLSPVEEG